MCGHVRCAVGTRVVVIARRLCWPAGDLRLWGGVLYNGLAKGAKGSRPVVRGSATGKPTYHWALCPDGAETPPN